MRLRLRAAHPPDRSALLLIGLLMLLALLMLSVLLPVRGADLFTAYGYAAIAFLAALFFYDRGVHLSAAEWLFLAYLLWVLVTRWLCGDVYLFIHRDQLYRLVLSFLFFVIPSQLSEARRERLLLWATLLYALFYTLAAAAGLFVAVTDTYIHIPPENVWITVTDYDRVAGLNLLSVMRLVTAPRLCLAMALLVYQFVRCRKTAWRVLIAAALLILHAALALCHSRSAQICLSVSWSLLALLLLLEKQPRAPRILRALSLVLVPLLALALCYKSFDVCSGAASAARAALAPRFAAAYSVREAPVSPDFFGVTVKAEAFDAASSDDGSAAAQSSEEDASLRDERSLSGNRTLSGRVNIWRTVPLVLRENPRIALFGQSQKTLMEAPNRFLRELRWSNEYKNHMHNALLQVLLLTGVPGLLLVAAWMLITLWQAARLFFDRRLAIPLRTKLLTIPVAAMLLFNLVEVNIFSQNDLSGFLFFLLAGLAAAEYRERFCKKAAADADK